MFFLYFFSSSYIKFKAKRRELKRKEKKAGILFTILMKKIALSAFWKACDCFFFFQRRSSSPSPSEMFLSVSSVHLSLSFLRTVLNSENKSTTKMRFRRTGVNGRCGKGLEQSQKGTV